MANVEIQWPQMHGVKFFELGGLYSLCGIVHMAKADVTLAIPPHAQHLHFTVKKHFPLCRKRGLLMWQRWQE